MEVPRLGGQAEHLRSIGLAVTETDVSLDVEVPTFRPDLGSEEDLIEEVARLRGLDKVPATLPSGRAGREPRPIGTAQAASALLAGFATQEVRTSSFLSEEGLDRLGLDPDHPARRPVRLAHPMTEDETALRTTLMPALLKAAAHNLSRSARGAAFFEIARAYEPPLEGPSREELPKEPLVLGAIFSGERVPGGWQSPAEYWDLFSAKGTFESALASLGASAARYRTASGMPFHPTRAGAVLHGKSLIGAIGEVHPEVCERFDVPEKTVLLEIALEPLLASLGGRVRVADVPRFPPNLIDIALVVDEDLPADRVEDLIWKAGAPEVSVVRLFDLYRGDQVPPGKKSLAYALELRKADSSMTDEEAARVRVRVVSVLRERTGAELRS